MTPPPPPPPLPAPNLVLGCGSMSMTDVPAAFAVLDAFRESGGRTLDTARIYGTSENVVGEWLAARDVRDGLAVVTKGAHPGPDWEPRLSRAEILADLGSSLSALRLITVDGFLLHRDDPDRDVADIADTLAEIVRLGRARRVGVSNWSEDRVVSLIGALRAVDGPALAIVSNYGGLAVPTAPPEWPGVRSSTPELLRLAGVHGFEVLGWSALSAGFFSGDGSHPEFAGPENLRRREVLERIAADAGVPPIDLLVRTLATLHPDFAPVLSTRDPDRVLRVCTAARDDRLDEAVARLLASIRSGPQPIPAW